MSVLLHSSLNSHSGNSEWRKVVRIQDQLSSVAQSCRTRQPHGLQLARPPCLSPTPGVYLNSCPLSRWCHPTISFSVIPFSSCLQSFPASGSLSNVSSSHQVAKVLEFQLQHQSFQWIFRADFLKDELVGFPCCPSDSQESSPSPQFKSISSSVLSFLSYKIWNALCFHYRTSSFNRFTRLKQTEIMIPYWLCSTT